MTAEFEVFIEELPPMKEEIAEPMFAIGSLVRLASGGPTMTVLEVHNGREPTYDLIYFSEHIRVAERIPEAVLDEIMQILEVIE